MGKLILLPFHHVSTDNSGYAVWQPPIDLDGFSTVDLMIRSPPIAPGFAPAANVIIEMGHMTVPLFLSFQIANFPLSVPPTSIQSFIVQGPQLRITIVGPVNATIPVEGWIYLH